MQKLKSAVLHVVGRVPAADLGAVKLHKVLYYFDMFFYVEHGRSVTGSVYRKRPFGPTNDRLLRVIDELVQDGSLEVSDVNYFGYKKKEFRSTRSGQTNALSSDEVAYLNDVTDFVCKEHSAKTISDMSHSLAWELAKSGEVIPYHSVFHIFPSEPTKDTIGWADAEARTVADSGQNRDTVDFVSYASFRSRLHPARV